MISRTGPEPVNHPQVILALQWIDHNYKKHSSTLSGMARDLGLSRSYLWFSDYDAQGNPITLTVLARHGYRVPANPDDIPTWLLIDSPRNIQPNATVRVANWAGRRHGDNQQSIRRFLREIDRCVLTVETDGCQITHLLSLRNI